MSATLRRLFRGTWALVAPNRALFLHVPLAFGLAPALLLALVVRLVGLAPEDQVMALFVALLAMIVVITAAAGLPLTLPLSPTALAKREELLVLPLGRLAIPAAVLVTSLLGVAAWAAAAAVGLLVTLDLDPILRAAAAAPADRHAAAGLGLAAAFAVVYVTVTVANGAAAMALCWALGATLVGVSLDGMGYDPGARLRFAALATGLLGAYYVALPFVLHARPAHVWTRARQASENVPAVLTVVAVGVLTLLATIGAGWAALLVLLAGGALAWRSARRHPARRGVSAGCHALGLGLAVMAPLAITALAVDARGGVEPGRWSAATVVRVSPSPDGRHVAVQLAPRADGATRPRTVWTAVLDARGERPPLLLPSRFTELGDGHWSRGGRYLAVQDRAYGRLRIRVPHGRWELPRAHLADRLAARADVALQVKLVVDTASGEVTRREGLAVAPGWERPEQLVSVQVSAEPAGLELTDGLGRRALVPGAELLTAIGYDEDGAALLADLRRGGTVRHPVFGQVPRFVRRWTEAAPLDLAEGRRWVQRMNEGPPTVSRAGHTLELPRGTHVRLDASTAEALLVSDDRGIHRWSLDGTCTPALLRAGRAPTFVRDGAGPSGRLHVMHGGRPGFLDLATGGFTPAPDGAERLLAELADGRLLLEGGPDADGWPAVRDDDGAVRSLRPADD